MTMNAMRPARNYDLTEITRLLLKKRDNMASRCPICKKQARHISIPVGKNLCNIVCEGCGAVAKQNVEGIVPMVYVRLDLMEEEK